MWLGPLLALSIQVLGVPEGLSFAAWGTASLLVLMAVWWATEAIPIPATSLLPLAVLPMIGAEDPAAVAVGYSSPIVLLLMGGFVIALGIERWNLHKRIALNVVANVGSHPKALILGFMIATALLSMWISNTATTLMMVPIAISAGAALGDRSGRFVPALLLGICYAASIGGVATPIGTPTNLIAIDWLEKNTEVTIGFPQWMAFGIPAAFCLVPAAWWAVTRSLPRLHQAENVVEDIRRQRIELGRISTPEARAAIVFGFVAFLWVTRLWSVELAAGLGWPTLAGYSGLNVDMVIAIVGAIAMFLVPAGGGEKRMLLDWDEAVKLPWGVLLLFGGGIALGRAVSATGLSAWLGDNLEVLDLLPAILFIAVVVALVIFLTEVTSNVATMTTLAPVLGALALAIDTPPAALLGPAAVAASCAFMLPVATAPNAIVYASGKVTIGEMISRGFLINLMGIVIITAIGYWIAPIVL